jgi:hypothetical protein
MLLVDDLLVLPFKGLFGIFQKISEMADREFTDEAYIQGKLLELQLLYEMDEIGEEEYTQRAAELEARLNTIREAESGEESPEEVGPWDSKAAA